MYKLTIAYDGEKVSSWDFAEMFAKDNERFDVTRFHDASNYKVKVGK
jgi:hypothetical protein